MEDYKRDRFQVPLGILIHLEYFLIPDQADIWRRNENVSELVVIVQYVLTS